jgi:threonine/homoserine/homoserine lactone efflux protein
VVSGLLVWTGAAAIGVAFVLEESAFAFTVLKLAGAAYLAYLGIRALASVRKKDGHFANEANNPGNGHSAVGRMNSPFLQGLFSDIFNPKTAIVFSSLIVQFVAPGPSIGVELAELGVIFTVMAFCWLVPFSILIGATSGFLKLPRVRKALDAVTGSVLIGLGIWVATETR